MVRAWQRRLIPAPHSTDAVGGGLIWAPSCRRLAHVASETTRSFLSTLAGDGQGPHSRRGDREPPSMGRVSSAGIMFSNSHATVCPLARYYLKLSHILTIVSTSQKTVNVLSHYGVRFLDLVTSSGGDVMRPLEYCILRYHSFLIRIWSANKASHVLPLTMRRQTDSNHQRHSAQQRPCC